MVFAVDLTQAAGGDVGIDFGRADAGMAEQLLNDAQVSPVIEEMGRKAVAQRVGGDVPRDAGTPGALFDALPQGHGSEMGAASG